MRTVDVSEEIHASVDDVWALVTDIGRYPDLMDPVLAIRVLDSGDPVGAGWTLAEWEVELKGSVLKWTEREDKDPTRFRVDYAQVDGDLDRFEGYWQLHEVAPLVTRAVLVVQFEVGIPMLRDMLEPVAARAVEENSRRMLRSLDRGPAIPPLPSPTGPAVAVRTRG